MRNMRKGLAVLSLAVLLSAVELTGSTGWSPKASAASSAAANPTISVYVPANVEDFPAGTNVNHNELVTYIDQQTGYNVQWSIQPQTGVSQKISVMMTSGETPDLIATGDTQLFQNLAVQGLLAPLGSYINQVGSRIKKEVPKDLWSAVSENGKILAIPVPQNQQSTDGILIRKDILDALHLKTPQTLEQFYHVLKTVHEKYPKMIPFVSAGAVSAGVLNYLGSFAGAFGLASPYSVHGGRIVSTYTASKAKDFLGYLNMLYSQGLLGKGFPVNQGSNIDQEMSSGTGFMTDIDWADAREIVLALKDIDPKAKLEYIAPPVGADGLSGTVAPAPIRTYLMVPIFNKQHAKEVVDFINEYMKPNVLSKVDYGWKGVDYDIKRGQIEPLPHSQEIRYRIYYTLWDTIPAFLNRVRLKGFAPYYYPIRKYDTVKDIADFAPPNQTVGQYSQPLTDLVNQYFVKFIAGALPLSDFSSFTNQWESSGGSATLKALNQWYVSQKK